MNITRALITVSNKSKIINFTKFLITNNVQIYTTDGTEKYINNNNIKSVSSISNYNELLGGKVKILHPKIIGSILTDKPIKEYNIKPFQLVVCNLYPFQNIIKETNDEETILSNIDIGGHTLLRSSIKNYKNVLSVIDPNDYKFIMNNWNNIDKKILKNMASKTSSYITDYDKSINQYFYNKSLYN
jgi:phosphoribosylaminoimidazolecarboxamide formyltransferase / IMP cyclohydrolase